MSVYGQTRSSVARWREILIATYDELLRLGAADVWVYGSQAMSLYLTRPLASKDLDLLASGTTLGMMNKLCKSLKSFSKGKSPYYSFQNPEHEGRPNPLFSIYLNGLDEKPFAIELFQTYNGHEVRELTPYSTAVKRWKHEFQTLSVEAIIGTRLAFRPPERISTFNAERLNSFIESKKSKIRWSRVEEFIRKFELEGRVDENLAFLRRRGIKIKDASKLTSFKR